MAGVAWNKLSLPSESWSAAAVSKTGEKMILCTYDGVIYTSHDTGSTWVKNTSLEQKSLINVAMSADGSRIVAVDNSEFGNIFVSSDGGATWVGQTGIELAYFMSCSISDDGLKIVASADSKSYISSDGGNTWKVSIMPHSASSVLYSPNGSFIAAFDSNFVFTSRDDGETWVVHSELEMLHGVDTWESMCASSTGLAICESGGCIYTTNNIADDTKWMKRTDLGNKMFVKLVMVSARHISEDSAHDILCLIHPTDILRLTEYATDSYNYMSGNMNLENFSIVPTKPAENESAIVMCAKNSDVVIVRAGLKYYISVDSLQTYRKLDLEIDNVEKCAASSDGTKIAILLDDYHRRKKIYVSSDHGTTWVEQTISTGDNTWNVLDMSLDGSKIIVGTFQSDASNRICITTDGGLTWNTQYTPDNRLVHSLAMSADGNKIVCCMLRISEGLLSDENRLFISQDCGATWSQPTTFGAKSAHDVAISADGNMIIAASSAGIQYDQDKGCNVATDPDHDYIFISHDFGNTWIKNIQLGQKFWNNVFIPFDKDGTSKKIIVTTFYPSNRIYMSSDSGVTWHEEMDEFSNCYTFSSNSENAFQTFSRKHFVIAYSI